MGYIVYQNSQQAISLSGTKYTGLDGYGTHHLCLRTGTGTNDVVRYGLTTDTTATGLKIRIGNTNVAIANRYATTGTFSSTRTSAYTSSQTLSTASRTQAATRTSQYTSSQTLSTASRTQAATRTSQYVSSQTLSTASQTSVGYRGVNTSQRTSTTTNTKMDYATYRTSSHTYNTIINQTYYDALFINNIVNKISTLKTMNGNLDNLYNFQYTLSKRSLTINNSLSSYITHSSTYIGNDQYWDTDQNIPVYELHFRVTGTTLMSIGNGYFTKVTTPHTVASRSSLSTKTASRTSRYTLSTASSTKLSTRTTSRVSNYTLSTASSTKLSTNATVRNSNYTATVTNSTKHNANF